MQAINHIATALILKKKVPSAPLVGLIIATEAVELLWVVLNLVGIERTIIDRDMQSVADIHLIHMPFSHSIFTSVIFAAMAGLFILWRKGRAASAVALAVALAVVSHILLDLLVHAPDIAIAPFFEGRKYGTGLYANLPFLALVIETLWGLLCWRIYRGNKKLLGLIVLSAVLAVPNYTMAINSGAGDMTGTTFSIIILTQIVVTSLLVWVFARRPHAAVASAQTNADVVLQGEPSSL